MNSNIDYFLPYVIQSLDYHTWGEQMFIFELVKPGSHIKLEDRELAWKFEGLLRHLETAFYDANISLNFFEHERNSRSNSAGFSQQQWANDFQKRQILEQQVRKEFGFQPYENQEEVRLEAEIRLKREKWAGGSIPLNHQHQFIFLHAKSFLYAMDTIDKFLKAISEEPGCPPKIRELHAQIAKGFPDLRAVRNSAQHLEDRARGLGAGRERKPLVLKPLDNGFINAPQGALMLNNLFGTKFGCTMADGHYGEVDISAESLSKLQLVVQDVFNSFEWEGPKQHLPH